MLFSLDGLIKSFYQLQNRLQQRRRKSLEMNHCPNRDNDHHFLSQKDEDINLQKIRIS